MKKKFYSVILAFAFILTGAFCLTACGENSSPSKTLTSITSNVISHSHYDGFQFNYTYGETIQISKSDFTVIAHYSDNSETSVSDFTLDTSKLPIGIVSVGTYEISVHYQSKSNSYNVVVDEQSLDLTAPSFENPVYTGEEIDFTSISAIQTFMTENNLKVAQDSQSSIQKNAGDYTLKLESNNANITGSFDINWQITKKPIVLADFLVSTGLTQNNENKNIYEVTYNGSSYNLSSNANYIFVSNNDSYTNAGDYYYNFTTDSNHKFITNGNEYTTSDEEELNLTLRINKIQLDFNKNDIALTKNDCAYTGSAFTLQELLAPNYLTLSSYFDITLNNGNLTDVGTKNIVLTAKESICTNYKYKNGDEITGDEINLYFTIVKTTPNYEGIDTVNNITFEVSYSENLTLSSIINSVNLTQTSVSWLQENLGYSDCSGLRSNDNEPISAGTYTKTISYTPDYNNYNPIDIQVTVIVNKATIYIDHNWYFYRNNSLIYKESDITYDITYPVEVEFATGNTEVTASLQTYYKQTEANNYGSENIASLQNAGYYKTVATLNYDNFNPNYQICILGSTNIITSVEKEWQIIKKTYEGNGDADLQWVGINFYNANVGDATIVFEPQEAIELSVSITGAQKDQFKVSQINVQYKAKENDEYTPISASNIKAVGYYKAEYVISCTTGNYDVNISDDLCKAEFEIIPSQVDCSKTTLAIENRTYTKTEWLNQFSNFDSWLTNSKGLALTWDVLDENGNSATYMKTNIENGVPGKYKIILTSANVNDSYQNYENATLINAEHLNPTSYDDKLKVDVIIVDDTLEKSNISGKSSVFVNMAVINENNVDISNYSEIYDMTNSIKLANLGYTDEDGDGSYTQTGSAATAIASADNNTISGTCAFGGDSFDELITAGQPYIYTYNEEGADSIKIYIADNNGAPLEETILSGNIYGDYLVLNMKILVEEGEEGNKTLVDTGLVWQITFQISNA